MTGRLGPRAVTESLGIITSSARPEFGPQEAALKLGARAQTTPAPMARFPAKAYAPSRLRCGA